jgi:hypothetical protein
MSATKQIPWVRLLVEGAVIVGSILLAFGIDAWWDGVQESRDRDAYVLRLVRDLETDVATWEGVAASVPGKQASLDRVLSWVRSPDLARSAIDPLLQDVVQGARLAYGGVAIRPQRSTFDALVSTGALRLLSPTLRDALLDYQSQVDYSRSRLIARETEYAQRAYGLVPRDGEYVVSSSLTESERVRVAERLLREDLEALVIAESNRANLLSTTLQDLIRGATELLAVIPDDAT